MEKNTNITSIPKEKFAFANLGDHIKDQKFDDKPVGYFKDAWLRFCKNKASIIAACIIICIVLFAIIAPFFNANNTGTKAETRYMRMAPRNLFLSNFGIATGDKNSDEARDTMLIHHAATGIGALLDENGNPVTGSSIPTVGDAISSGDSLQPITKYQNSVEVSAGAKKELRYNYKYDQYLAVGYAFLYVEQDEYQRMLAWQEETGIQLLYPMIAENEYNFAITAALSENANWWYKTNVRGVPLKSEPTGFSAPVYKIEGYDDIQNITLIDNYERDSAGNLVYYKYSGGGDANTAMYKVRVLFYNYYQYTHNGAEPEFIFGTDSTGYDLAYRLAIGIRLSLLLSICIFAINFVLGAMYGAIEGYYGGNVDLVLEFISYVLSGVPFMVVATLFQIHLAAKVGPIPSLLFAFIVTGWIGTAARVRTQFYRFKNQEYVMAARTLGAKDIRIIWKHIFPNTLGTIITASVLSIPGVIFSESMLSYLGIINLGSSKTTSLGTLLSDASAIWQQTPHLMFFPALIISLLMICFNLFGNGLRDAFNPSLRGVEE